MKRISAFLAMDIGNSCVKISDAKKLLVLQNKTLSKNSIDEAISQYAQDTIIYSSVNENALKKIKNALRSKKFINITPYLTSANSPLKAVRSKNTGSDRLLGVVGALRYAAAPLITVDFGTATTINVLNKKREFLGGAILPGITTQLNSMSRSTDKLPVVVATGSAPTVGKSTREAMQSGVLFGTVGAVLYIVNQICSAELKSNNVAVFVTGGNARLVVKQLKKSRQFTHINDLVIQGIVELSTLID